MPAHLTPPPRLLAVTFSRPGDPDITVEVPDGDKALIRAVTMLLMNKRLEPGDTLTVTEVKVD